MTKGRPSKSKDYEVGYGRPPKTTQFAPGTSGNPKGRPKGARSVAAIVQEMMRQKFSVSENGRTRRMSAIEVALRRLFTDAMRGDARARKDLFVLVDRYGAPGETGPRLTELLAEDQEILSHYLPKSAELATDSALTIDGADDDAAE